ncbi:hypothetical protein MAPG_01570 [Magnaporthiopsis poae ATCC 64411]|uniref:Uncharacterized protein n=1 Tax=Magnaporthiopsis poae (strain ATCC 64411 / 73-15) TaxID=644358 RepID=A0A0C4DP20_MAGP6|nr:hypothetical protein MAPG_01570 [Magnaporthiopsis poae ATCC 64411]
MEADTSSSLTRLHITPLDPDLLKIIVPATVLPSAKNISFHTLEAFPEKRYGFVELPTIEADKIKKKLNGAVLKGVKIRIEKARFEKMPRHDKDDAAADAGSKKTSSEDRSPRVKEDSSKKRKRQREEIPGVELEEGRRVKRGWTTTEATETTKDRKSKKDRADKKDKKDKKDRKEKKQRKKEIRSRYTDAPECLIKAVIPTAAAAAATTAETDDQGSSSKKRKSKNKTETVVIHEFEKTTKFPTFLKNSAAESSKTSATNEFVEGVGWISQDSKIVEAARSTRTSRKTTKDAKSPSPSPPPPAADDTTSSSGSDSDDHDTSSDDDGEGETDAPMAPPRSKARRQTISIPEASSPAQKVKDSNATSKTESPRPKSAGSVMSLTIKIPPSTPATPKVHPLEALYKRSKPDGGAAGTASGTPAQPSFAFFDAEGDQADEEHGVGLGGESRGSLQPPMTPFTRQDMEFRNVRSAAPTPDTAHHSRSFKFWPTPGQEDIDEEDDEEEGDDGDQEDGDDDDEDDESGARDPSGADETTSATSDFQKWFWENRGDLNRSWKKRRKSAAKEKRYRENRSRANRAV